MHHRGNITHVSETATSGSNVRFWVTAAALKGSGSALQPLFMLFRVIYEPNWISLTLCVLAAGVFSVVVSWFPVILGAHCRAVLKQVHMKMLRFCRPPPPSLSLFFSFEGFYPLSFVCAAGKLSRDYSSSPPPQIFQVCWRQFSWILNCPMQPERALLKPFVLFGTNP